MKIAMLGAGNVGSALAARLVTLGHHVTLVASDPASARLAAAAAASGAEIGTAVDAATVADHVVLAVPFAAIDDLLTDEVRDALAGKVVIDATNPLAADFMSLTVGHTTSGGERVAERLPRSHVVKAFNTIFAATLGTPTLGGAAQLLPVAGDDAGAKRAVIDLGIQLGFDAIDAGPLSNARYLEPAVELLIQLAYGQGLGANIGLHLARG
ncbi:NADPH-dependent F420 reductase [Actinoplanes sp. NEAU-A12]|uniref:NADPH-dependent F420 reductase n=2 Tax=Actinoplanes sandaracinus TaxID=3045177 RepID=A0ABT6WLW8_9ACTN|nr:NADPH-dependent F420 reductase [Actinoplanes sandaracinus]MDI6100705.1 NADPH-dependent F420 reductase [Actinoplanes sandaracinus]